MKWVKLMLCDCVVLLICLLVRWINVRVCFRGGLCCLVIYSFMIMLFKVVIILFLDLRLWSNCYCEFIVFFIFNVLEWLIVIKFIFDVDFFFVLME